LIYYILTQISVDEGKITPSSTTTGFSVVQDGMNCFPQHYQAQLHGAKAMRALLQLGGVEAIEENVKQRALAMLLRAATRFDSVDEHEIRTVAKEARDLLQCTA